MRQLDVGSQRTLVFAARFVLVGCSLSVSACRPNILCAVEPCEPKDRVAECTVTRDECTSGFSSASTCTMARVHVSFPATDCFRSTNPNGQAHACGKFCNLPTNNDPHAPQLDTDPTRLWDTASGPEFCQIQATYRNALPGECARTTGVASNGATASAQCDRAGRACNQTAQSGGLTICTSRAPLTTESGIKCFDPTQTSAEDFCEDDFISSSEKELQIPRLRVSNVMLNDAVNCPQTAASGPVTAYGLNAGALGTAVHGSDIFALNTTGGFLKFSGTCDSSGNCSFTELRDMRVTLSDVVVAGVSVQNVEVRLTRPAPIVVTNGVRKIAQANFKLQLTGSLLGGTSSMPVFPSSDIVLGVNGQTASFSFWQPSTARWPAWAACR